MAKETGISWTDSTWNPIRGCSRVSEGCTFCYAETMAGRFSGPGQPYEGLVKTVHGRAHWTGTVAFVERHLLDPLRWRTPAKIFVSSMSDLFHENVPDAVIDQIMAVMQIAQQHVFQVLTKRPQRMLLYLQDPARRASIHDTALRIATTYPRLSYGVRTLSGAEADWRVTAAWPLPHVWLGTSIERDDVTDRAARLAAVPAAVHFISAEPLLGPLPSLSLAGIEWVICGGESGPHLAHAHVDHRDTAQRQMKPEWARDLYQRCQGAGVPFWMKQHSGVRSGAEPYVKLDDQGDQGARLIVQQWPRALPARFAAAQG